MLFTPLNNQNVVTTLANQIVDVINVATSVFDEALFAWTFWTIHTDIEDVVACEKFILVI